MTKTTRKNSSNVEALNDRSDVNNVGLSNSQPTFSKKRFPSDAGTGSYRKKKGDSEQIPLQFMFDMLQDAVADLRSENASRLTFLVSSNASQFCSHLLTCKKSTPPQQHRMLVSPQFQPYWVVHLFLILQAQKHLLTS